MEGEGKYKYNIFQAPEMSSSQRLSNCGSQYQACNILFSEQTDAKLLSTRKDECGEQESCYMVR